MSWRQAVQRTGRARIWTDIAAREVVAEGEAAAVATAASDGNPPSSETKKTDPSSRHLHQAGRWYLYEQSSEVLQQIFGWNKASNSSTEIYL
jgi:hypothetical protein